MSELNTQAAWYVVHTYSGYENKVKVNLEKTVQNRNMQDVILEVRVPVEDVVEKRKNKSGEDETCIVQRKIFPGYVMIHMVMNNQTWYIVRNTRGVTGFVGPESKPIPLSDEEMSNMGIGAPKLRYGFEPGDLVLITSGPLSTFQGEIVSLDYDSLKAVVMVSMFGRDTKTELDFEQITKI